MHVAATQDDITTTFLGEFTGSRSKVSFAIVAGRGQHPKVWDSLSDPDIWRGPRDVMSKWKFRIFSISRGFFFLEFWSSDMCVCACTTIFCARFLTERSVPFPGIVRCFPPCRWVKNTWRIIPFGKWLESPTFISHLIRPFGRGPTTRSLGSHENDRHGY